MATFRSSNHQISASSVYTNGDLTNLIQNLYRQSIRAGANGDYARGLHDMAQSIAAATNCQIDLYLPPVAPASSERITERYERIEERRERTVERYAQPPAVPAERQFKIVGEREALPAPPIALARPEPVNMTGDDVNVTVFNPAHGRLVTREIGHAWFGNDGTTTYWNASDWQRVPPEEYERWGEALPEGWAVLVRHAYANAKRRQVTANNRGLLR